MRREPMAVEAMAKGGGAGGRASVQSVFSVVDVCIQEPGFDAVSLCMCCSYAPALLSSFDYIPTHDKQIYKVGLFVSAPW